MLQTSTEEVGKQYKEFLGTRNADLTDPGNRAASAVYRTPEGTVEAGIQEMKAAIRAADNSPNAFPKGENELNKQALSYLESGKELPSQEGYLYKHDLPDEDIARYLDWDAPLSEQTQAVQDIAARFGIKTTPSGMKEARGSDIYRAIGHAEQKPPFDTGSMNPGSREGSEALRKAGIPGLKYYDGMSRKKNLMIDGVAASRGVEMDAADYVRLWGPDRIERIKIEINGERGLKKKKELIAAVEDIVHNNKAVTEEMSGTRNYVTWDQDVLDRMKLLERNGESMIDALR